jgi:flagellar biosynthesis protein FlhA
MPGKQMAIDADLNAGLLDEREAGRRRDRVRREADFYGAMDGAIRFTQRDAIAALLITGVNIIAGLIIGVFQHGLDLGTAGRTYTILTVGEGLVTAIPALLVAVAGALITTRAASASHLGEEVAAQLFARPKPLAIGAGMLVALAVVPGLPKLPFILVAGVLGAAAYANAQRDVEGGAEAEAEVPPAPESLEAVLAVEPLSIGLGYALIPLVDEKQGGTLLARVRSVRRQIALDSGVVVPPVHIADNLQNPPRVYTILVKGVEVARGELHLDRWLAIDPGTASEPIEGVPTREPAFGLPARWITPDLRDKAATAGYTIVDPVTALSTHLSETVRAYLPDLLTRQQTKEMVDRVAQTSPKLVEDLVPKLVSLGDIQRVLRQLLRERVPVRDLVTILEAIADAASTTKDPDAMTEQVRAALGNAICHQYQNEKGELSVISFAPKLEERLLSSIAKADRGLVLALEPAEAQKIASRIASALEKAVAQPVLLCCPALRPHLWRLFARVLPQVAVLSHSEVPGHVRIVPLTVLD